MSDPNRNLKLRFPCDCVSGRNDSYGDPWSDVTKNKLFSDGTKEEIVNLISEKPKTISQLATALNLSAPSIHKHVNELLASELIRDSVEWEKLHPKERYYEPNFPVVRAEECEALHEICERMSESIADLFQRERPHFEEAFEKSGAARKGWSFDDLSQCVFARIQRNARELLEQRGLVTPPQPHRNGAVWSFWAEMRNGNQAE
ncbi:MAG TPA: winged helix-turn-helix domain-containing protein [Pyrinomonadaceae bacterium]